MWGAPAGLSAPPENSVAILDPGPKGNLARLKWLKDGIPLHAKHGFPPSDTYASTADLKFGNGCLGQGHHATYVPAAICRLSARARKRPGHRKRRKGSSRLAKSGVRAPVRSNAVGHYVLSAARLDKLSASPYPRGDTRTAAWFRRDNAFAGHGFPAFGISRSESKGEQRHLKAPLSFQACTAVMFEAALHLRPQGARGIARKLHLNLGHASSQQLKRVPVDADRANKSLLDVLDDVAGQHEACRALDKAPNLPVEGASLFPRLERKWRRISFPRPTLPPCTP